METPPPPQPPQDPVSYTPPPAAQPHYAPPTGPTIRFDVIGQAFNMIFADLATWAVAALSIFAVIAVVMGAFYFLLFAVLFKGGFILLMFGELILVVLMVTATNLMMANMYRMAIIALSGSKPNVNEMFKFGPESGNVLVASLLVGLATGIGCLFCYLPGLVIGGALMFTLPLVVDRKMAAMDAINLSWQTLKKDIALAALFFIAVGVCAELGVALCGVGMVLTLPVMPIAIAMLYRDYLGFASVAPEPS